MDGEEMGRRQINEFTDFVERTDSPNTTLLSVARALPTGNLDVKELRRNKED